MKIKPMQDSNVGPYACLWGPYRSYVVCSTWAPVTGFQEKKDDVVAYVMQRFKIQDSTTLFLELNQEIAGFRVGAAVQWDKAANFFFKWLGIQALESCSQLVEGLLYSGKAGCLI